MIWTILFTILVVVVMEIAFHRPHWVRWMMSPDLRWSIRAGDLPDDNVNKCPHCGFHLDEKTLDN